MKKNYVTPQMEIYRIQMSNSLLETSDLTPKESFCHCSYPKNPFFRHQIFSLICI